MHSSKFITQVKRVAIAGLLLSQIVSLCPSAAIAAENDVKIAGHVVIVNKSGSGDETVDQRTATIQQNLDKALVATNDPTPASVKVSAVRGVYSITLGGHKIVTVDSANARLAKTTTQALANKWATAIRTRLNNRLEIDQYVAQLKGTAPSTASAAPPAVAPAPEAGATSAPNTVAGERPTAQAPIQGRVVFAPAGLNIPLSLTNSISTESAKAGDLVQGQITQDVNLGNGVIPAGSLIEGQVTDAEPGRRLNRSGVLSIKFVQLRTPDGTVTPLQGHLVGGLGKYMTNAEGDTLHGETMKQKLESAAMRGLVGAGGGAVAGTAVGAVAGGGHGAGKGALAGTVIGAGVGVADSLLARKAADIVLPSGTAMQLQLDAPLSIGAQ